MNRRLAGRAAWVAIGVGVAWLLAPAWAADGVRSAREALVAEAVKGKLTARVVELYYDYAEQCARAAAPPGRVAADFWKWLAARPTIREGVLAGMDCAYAGHVAARLEELRGAFLADVDRFPHLAIAFALVYGRAGDESIRLWDWVAKGRPVPPMVESFRYFVAHRGEMLFPLDATPWPLLVHVADIEVPIAEREWVLAKYRGRPLESLRRVHTDLPYKHGAYARKMARQEGAPMALPRICQEGGVCSQKAYYAASVLKSLGVPAFRLTGNHHAWEGWVVPEKPLRVNYAFMIGRKSGRMKCPLSRTAVGQHEVDMSVAATSESYSGYLAARVAGAAYALVPEDRRRQATGLLRGALSRNAFCTQAWRHLAQAAADGVLTGAEAEKLYPTALRALAGHPQMTCEIFTTLIAPRLQATEGVDERTLAELTREIEREASRYEGLKREDLGVQLRNLLGSTIAAVQGPSAACERYRSWLPRAETGWRLAYRALFQHLMKLTKARVALAARAEFLAGEVARQPARFPPSRRARRRNPKAQGEVNARYVMAASAYVNTLRRLGRKGEAAELKAKIRELTNEDAEAEDEPPEAL